MAFFGSLVSKLFGRKASPADDAVPAETGAPAIGESQPIPTGSSPSPQLGEDGVGEGQEESDGAMPTNPIAAAAAAAASPTAEESAPPVESAPAFEPEPPEPPEAPEPPALPVEELCGIDPETMDREAIRQRLAELYRRHNAAAGSLNVELRAEAEQMLDAIVICRERYIDPS